MLKPTRSLLSRSSCTTSYNHLYEVKLIHMTHLQVLCVGVTKKGRKKGKKEERTKRRNRISKDLTYIHVQQ